jgi:hypothetical protein
LLTEFANRAPGLHPPAIPIWLVEGLSARLMTSVGPDLVVTLNPLLTKLGDSVGQLQDISRDRIGAPTLQEVRAWLLGRTPLTFNELSLPDPEQLAGDNLTTYRRCAELLFFELQRLPRGRRCLTAMLARLPESLNWQTAFLRAFESHFGRLLDVEKWWSVTSRHFLLGDQPHAWSRETTVGKLSEVLQVRVEVRAAPDATPRPGLVSLQEFIAKSDFGTQRSLINGRLGHLKVIKTSGALELVPLIENYISVLEDYLTQRAKAGYAPHPRRVAPSPPALLLRETTRRLDQLDRERNRFQAAASATSVRPGGP